MKKNICAAFFSVLCLSVFCNPVTAQESEENNSDDEHYEYHIADVVIPDAKRPRKATEDELVAADSKNEAKAGNEYIKRCTDTFLYGLEDEIATLLDELTANEDLRFVDPIYDLFQTTKNPVIRQKILSYFTKLKDPCLEDYAVTVVDDPYDEKKDTVSACFEYIAAVDCKNAIPCLVTLLDKEEEDYFNSALTTLGEIAGKEEALYLADYLDRDDLTTAQRQALMKVLGKIQAVETYDKLADIAQNEDENSFVRMYAAEAIGAMEKPEAEDILIKLFEESDPNFRVYVIKGICHYSDAKADNLILQGLRDSQWKVRLESVNSVGERDLKSAVPFLVYRCKDTKEEKNVKSRCYNVIAKLNTQEGNDYLISVIKDTKVSDTTKASVAGALLEYNHAGTQEIIALAEESLKNDLMKNLRYALGKEFAKWGRPEFETICSEYIASTDVSTQGTGLDIFAKGKYASVRPVVEALALEAEETDSTGSSASAAGKTSSTTKPKAKKVNANAKKAKLILQRLDSLSDGENESSESGASVDVISSASQGGNSVSATSSDNAADAESGNGHSE